MENSIIDFDLSGLRGFYKSNATARHILESLAARTNNWKMTTVSSLFSYFKLTGVDISRQEIVSTFREFERFKCGKFMIGKIRGNRNFQSRFLWDFPLATVGRLALNKKNGT